MNGESKHDIKEKIRQRYKGGDAENMHMIPARPKESLFEENTEKKVCAYCRVSTDDPRQTSSYELQKNHYEEFIREHPGWVLVDIYADEGITGTIHSKFHACQLCVHSADLSLYHQAPNLAKYLFRPSDRSSRFFALMIVCSQILLKKRAVGPIITSRQRRNRTV